MKFSVFLFLKEVVIYECQNVRTKCSCSQLPACFFHESIGCAEGKAVSRHEAEIQRVKVILQRVYLDGDLGEEIVMESVLTKQEIQEKYKQWQLIEQQGNILIFRNQVDDISPLLKANGYFGITKEGTLTIFNGRPKHSKVIHSFFQIDVGKLESRKNSS